DGSTSWASPITIGDSRGSYFDSYYDGTYFYYARTDVSDGDIYFRKGTPNSDGSVTWAAVEQSVAVGSVNTVAIAAIDGYPYIYFNPANHSTLYKSSTNDGTWSTDATFTHDMDSGNNTSVITVLTLSDGDIYTLFQS